MITIRYERLYNLGNFENEKLSIELPVEDGNVAQAFGEARCLIEQQHAMFEEARKEAERQAAEERRAEWEARRREPDPEF